MRIKFVVKAISGERIPLGWESFELNDSLKRDSEGTVLLHLGRRLRDCCMPNSQINTMIQQFIGFARQNRDNGRQRKISAAVDVEVCTAQRQGEAIAAAVDRAMKPEHLPPLHLYPMIGIVHPPPPPPACLSIGDIRHLKAVGTTWVEDVEEAMRVMDLCAVCGRKPIVGTQILPLLCGHQFHYHCVALRLLEETNSCPTCNHQPAISKRLSLDSLMKFDNYESYSEDEDDVIGRSIPFPTGDNPFWSQTVGYNDDEHRPTTVAQMFWSRLLDKDDDDDDECDRRRRLDNDDDDEDDEDDPDYDPDRNSDLDDF